MICDGYEVIDRCIVVIGMYMYGYSEVMFFCMYLCDIILIVFEGNYILSNVECVWLSGVGIVFCEGFCDCFSVKDNVIYVFVL